jgi:AcrR family transcriptional regulator
MSVTTVAKHKEGAQTPPRERILAAARELFYRNGIRAVGVEAIAEAAGTNKMTLYRHFPSKDELIAQCLKKWASVMDACWVGLERDFPGDPLAQLRGWLRIMADRLAGAEERGCALSNAAIELPEKDHPARRVIEAYKTAHRDRLAELAREAGLRDPEMLADELHMMLEGARVTAQSVGTGGLDKRLVRMGEALIAAHASGAWPHFK